jgi:hypothetical protein
VNNIRKETRNSKIFVNYFSYIIVAIQIVIASLRVICSIKYPESTVLSGISALQNGFHALLCFCIVIIGFVLFYRSVWNKKIPDAEKRLSVATLMLMTMISILIFIRGLSNIVLVILECLSIFQSFDCVGVFIHFSFPLFFDFLPMIFMGIIGIIQDPPKSLDQKNPAAIKLRGGH